MITAMQILQSSGIAYQTLGNVYLTSGNQLIGSFIALKRFQLMTPAYFGWHAHHIVEKVDLDRLGIAAKFPGSDDQICVLLPERAHVGRINSILRRENPLRDGVTVAELLPAYQSAYELMGNYSGGGQAAIQAELMKIVSEVLKQVDDH